MRFWLIATALIILAINLLQSGRPSQDELAREIDRRQAREAKLTQRKTASAPAPAKVEEKPEPVKKEVVKPKKKAPPVVVKKEKPKRPPRPKNKDEWAALKEDLRDKNQLPADWDTKSFDAGFFPAADDEWVDWGDPWPEWGDDSYSTGPSEAGFETN